MFTETISSCFQASLLENEGIIYRWNLNLVPDPVTQILYLSELIQDEMNKGRQVKIRMDKRKRAAGLYVLFSNPPTKVEVQ
jgi:hypothetical protein